MVIQSRTSVSHSLNIYWAPIEVKEGTGGHIFRNNLTNLPIQLRGTTGTFLEGNIEYATTDYFVVPGDAHLRADSVAIGAGVTPSATTSISTVISGPIDGTSARINFATRSPAKSPKQTYSLLI
jgi:hypothetical protein